ncbi:hypothetical protein NLJ89_g8300 [Agrocybe chaxingu]|uniref:DUF4246 domain-containing protein n=1 Tax=Agrocybe chaxingu TaxID=84603 RepID=A0A9W8K2Q3_9AGAR|nr:hypothetical protein NLJ89_g8300 [Agrocybe chaxingu]
MEHLADVVKILLFENQMETLLMLVQHPDVPIDHLHYLSWGHHFGFSKVKESALQAYLYFNCADATNTLENGQYALPPIPHRNFLIAYGVLDAGGHFSIPRPTSHQGSRHWAVDVLMYRYDVFMREGDLDREWEKETGFYPKLANIILTPENPDYTGRTWNVKGQLNEHICATVLYYYLGNNITESELAFRKQSDTSEAQQYYEQDAYR